MQHDEKTYIKRSRKPFSFKIFFAVMLTISLITGIAEIYSHNQKQTAAYDNALQSVSQGDFSAAEQQFSALSDYRDSRPLSAYCKYAALYKDRTDYAGGEDVLSTLNLQYDVQLQKDIDTLESRIKDYKAVKDKQIAKELEKKRKKQYSGKLPVEDMPASCLKYTSIGSPTKIEKCWEYDRMDIHRRYKIMYWYNSKGDRIAYCHSHLPKGENEEIIYAFSYKEPTPADPNSTPSEKIPGSNSSIGLRDDYDNPEDLWEEEQDWYEDEDEAWDEWYDD